MKSSYGFLLLLALIGCNSSDTPPNTVQLKATGIAQSVLLTETISGNTYTITNDGDYDLSIPADQKLYQIEISATTGQHCTLSEQLDLECEIRLCAAYVEPVCAKVFHTALIQCVTTPCDTDTYQTYNNSCLINTPAWIAFDSECGGIESLNSPHVKPVYVTDLALYDPKESDPFRIISTQVIGDTLNINFEVSGGCGSHEFHLVMGNYFETSSPVTLPNTITYANNDNCEAIIHVDRQFDLTPIREIYHRRYPDASGIQAIELTDLGIYNFTLE